MAPAIAAGRSREAAADVAEPGPAGRRRPASPSGGAAAGSRPATADFSFARTHRIAHDPLPLLLGAYEEHGPIFSMRLLHTRVVFMLGPEANHFITVAHPENFHWRESSFGDLIPLLGDGLLTIDDAYHDRARGIMMPAFHREQVAASVEAMVAEAGAGDRARCRPAQVVDIYDWMRNLAMRIAMRALLGLDPDEAGKGAAAAEHFERALGFYGIDFHLRLLRGPGSPWRKMIASRAVLDEIVFGEIAERRAAPEPDRAPDILSLLLGVRDEAGEGFTDKEIRDQVMTLMFAGHDTSTSTLTFMMYELARHPDVLEKLCRPSRTRCSAARSPTSSSSSARCPTSTWSSTRSCASTRRPGSARAARSATSSSAATRVPRGAYVNYCSWASHRIPEVFPEPEAFIPERFTRERKAALPRGAYVPFGGGPRICIGKRFGQTEVKLVATMLLQRLRLDALPGRTMTVRQMPTLSPEGRPARCACTSRGRRLAAAMRALVISDTHFGAWTGRDLLREEFFLERLAPPLEGIDELIFLGDLFDFLFGSVGEAVDASDGLLRLIAEKLAGRRLVFLAGNHDHHLVHRDAENRLEAQLAAGAPPRELAPSPTAPGPGFFRSFLARRLPGVEVEIAYPTYSSAASSAPTATTSTPTPASAAPAATAS